jgi:hypothetical protein
VSVNQEAVQVVQYFALGRPHWNAQLIKDIAKEIVSSQPGVEDVRTCNIRLHHHLQKHSGQERLPCPNFAGQYDEPLPARDSIVHTGKSFAMRRRLE